MSQAFIAMVVQKLRASAENIRRRTGNPRNGSSLDELATEVEEYGRNSSPNPRVVTVQNEAAE